MADQSLHTAVAQRKLKLIRILVEGGADVNSQSYDGKTPLTIACCFLQDDQEDEKQYSIIKLLLLYKSDPNIQDIVGRTALMYSLKHMLSPQIIKLLLQNGADPNICDVNGRDATRFIRTKAISKYRNILLPYTDASKKSGNKDKQFIQSSKNMVLYLEDNKHEERRHTVQMPLLGISSRYTSDVTNKSKHPQRVLSLPSDTARHSSMVTNNDGRRRRTSLFDPKVKGFEPEKNEISISNELKRGCMNYYVVHEYKGFIEHSREIRSTSLHDYTSDRSDIAFRRLSLQEQSISISSKVSDIDRKIFKHGVQPRQQKLPPIK